MTLEDDVVDRVRREAHRTGRPFKQVVNDAIRLGLERRQGRAAGRFAIEPRDMGLRPGLDLDDIQGLLDHIDGPERR